MLVKENNRLIPSELDHFSENLRGRSKKEGLYDPRNEHDSLLNWFDPELAL